MKKALKDKIKENLREVEEEQENVVSSVEADSKQMRDELKKIQDDVRKIGEETTAMLGEQKPKEEKKEEPKEEPDKNIVQVPVFLAKADFEKMIYENNIMLKEILRILGEE